MIGFAFVVIVDLGLHVRRLRKVCEALVGRPSMRKSHRAEVAMCMMVVMIVVGVVLVIVLGVGVEVGGLWKVV